MLKECPLTYRDVLSTIACSVVMVNGLEYANASNTVFTNACER